MVIANAIPFGVRYLAPAPESQQAEQPPITYSETLAFSARCLPAGSTIQQWTRPPTTSPGS
jgi:hypothetical protein